jgi:hypothetical protein
MVVKVAPWTDQNIPFPTSKTDIEQSAVLMGPEVIPRRANLVSLK